MLAREKIHLAHNHFYDEILFNPLTNEVRITDLGTAELFYTTNGYFRGKYKEFNEMGAMEYARFEIPCLKDRESDMRDLYDRMMDSFKELAGLCKKAEYFNIVLMLKKTVIVMKNELEGGGDSNAWKHVYLTFPDLLESFVQTYFENVEKAEVKD